MIGEGLKSNSVLRELCVVRPILFLFFCLRRRCGEGAGRLTLALQNNNDIGDEGACALGDGLKANSSLEYLELVRLFHIYIFFVAFWDMVQGDMHALTLLLQDNNDIGDEGARALGNSLKVNSSLLFLKLVRLFIIVLSFL